MSFLSSARRLGYLFTDSHDHENVGHARSKLLENFRGGEESAKENLRTGQLHIDLRILKHQQYNNLQKFDPANCGLKLNRQGHLTPLVAIYKRIYMRGLAKRRINESMSSRLLRRTRTARPDNDLAARTWRIHDRMVSSPLRGRTREGPYWGVAASQGLHSGWQ